MKVGGVLISAALTAIILMVGTASAKVTGSCGNCHTMHNSQNGTSMVEAGLGALWSGSTLTGGSVSTPQNQLLVSDCVGCHSSDGTDPILTIGSTRIPIVYNTAQPTAELAGGNFYWVVQDQAKGHNIWPLSPRDSNFETFGYNEAPGQRTIFMGMEGSTYNPTTCAQSCHQTLTLTPAQNMSGLTGCQGCHNNLKHHGTDPAPGTPETAASGGYRFLGNITWPADTAGHNQGVVGIEDFKDEFLAPIDDWEYFNAFDDHNIYGRQSDVSAVTGDINEDNEVADWAGTAQSMGRFCAGCHGVFHAAGYDDNTTGGITINGPSPWLRHPSNFPIPDKDPYNTLTNYKPLVPVAKNLADVGNYNSVDVGNDQVFCLSCHRAHGSQYDDMLRFSYSQIVAHSSPGSTDGCFFCHSDKDS